LQRGRCLSAASIDREGCAVVDDELADCQSLVVAVDLPLDTDQTDAEVDKLSVQRSDASRPFDLLGIQIFLYKGQMFASKFYSLFLILVVFVL